MSTSTHPTVNDGLVQIQTAEEMIRKRVADERARLEREAGIVHRELRHFHKPI